MNLITIALFFVFAIVFHILVWRLHRPHRVHAWFFLYMLIGLPLLYLVLLTIFSDHSIYNNLLIILGYEFLFTSYVLIYAAIEQSSLSLDLIRYLKHNGKKMLADDLISRCRAEGMIKIRIRQLADEGFVELESGRLKITQKGNSLANFIQKMRNIFKIRNIDG